jgi:hypothetical protein
MWASVGLLNLRGELPVAPPLSRPRIHPPLAAHDHEEAMGGLSG